MYYLLLTLLMSLQLFSQQPETVFIKKKLEDAHGYKYKVKYYALKSDTSIKYGYYERYSTIKSLVEAGFYKNNVKDSTWRTYIIGKHVGGIGNYENGKKNGEWKYYTNVGTRDPNYDRNSPTILVKEGSYVDNNLFGVWKFYKNGKLEQQYDYAKDSLISSSKINDNYVYTIKTKTGTIEHKLERPPMLVGGNRTRIENRKQMHNGRLYQLSNGQDNVTYALSFWIRPNGETYGYEMVKGVNEGYDNFVITYYKENYKWIPGLLNGENIECKITVSEGYIIKN
jgi:antitoxin component YwqK of YwqJK toxin-antitoxin module